MRTIVFIVYALGALIGAVSFGLTEPFIALVATLVTPFVLLFLLEQFGIVRFQVITPEAPPDSLIYRAGQEQLTDQEAAEKYGWGIVNEMDTAIKQAGETLKNMCNERDKFIERVKGEQK